MNRTKAIGKLVSMIVAGTHALSVSSASSATGPIKMSAKHPDLTAQDVLSTIDRINRYNPNAAMRIEVALVADQSELVAAIAQAVPTCSASQSAASCVKLAIERLGGLTMRNLVSLAELSAALSAIGVPPNLVSEALDAYSTAVVDAVRAGSISEQFAAATLAGGTEGSLYL